MPTVIFAGRLKNLKDISDFVVKQAQSAGFNDSDVYAVQLAVDEAATNIIEHAYGGDGKGDIVCSCEVLKDGFEVRLSDSGRPFDYDSVPDPVVGVPIEKLKPRGLGVFLMRKMMDDVSYYTSAEEGNVLVMIKHKGK
jgi:serine/threonine-protein kinase RsbW